MVGIVKDPVAETRTKPKPVLSKLKLAVIHANLKPLMKVKVGSKKPCIYRMITSVAQIK